MPAPPLEKLAASSSVVCVVDTDEALLQRLVDLLAPLGADVQTYRSGAALLEQAVPEPLCVIAEMRLPDMTGIQFIESLRARGSTSPVILLAAESNVATAVSGMRAGALDFIEKPHVERLLAWHVRRLLESREPSTADRAS